MFTNNSAFKKRLKTVQNRISAACRKAQRKPDSLKLMAVSKRFPLSAIEIAIGEGLTLLGENRVQEAVEKIQTANFKASWELIGHLQSNKAKLAVEHFDRIQSIDSLKLARKIDRFAGELGKQQRVLIQVNTGVDCGKSGLLPSEADSAMEAMLSLPNLQIEGLMTIGPLPATPESARKAFELSMGMSDDLELAIEAGSTLLRVGSAIFGERSS